MSNRGLAYHIYYSVRPIITSKSPSVGGELDHRSTHKSYFHDIAICILIYFLKNISFGCFIAILICFVYEAASFYIPCLVNTSPF